jgi:hypothetical protein
VRHRRDAVRGEPDPVTGDVDTQELAERERVRFERSVRHGHGVVPVHNRNRLRRAPGSSLSASRRLVQVRGLAILSLFVVVVVVVVVVEEIVQPLVDRERVFLGRVVQSVCRNGRRLDPRAVRREADGDGRRRGAPRL